MKNYVTNFVRLSIVLILHGTGIEAQEFNPIQENLRYLQSLFKKKSQNFFSEKINCEFVSQNTLYDCSPQIDIQYNSLQKTIILTETVHPDEYKLSDAQMLGSKYFLFEKGRIRYGEPHIMLKVFQLQRSCRFDIRLLDTFSVKIFEDKGVLLGFRGVGADCKEVLKSTLYIDPRDSLTQEAWEFMEYHAPDRFIKIQESDLEICRKILNYNESYKAEKLIISPSNTNGEWRKVIRSFKTIYKYAMKEDSQ